MRKLNNLTSWKKYEKRLMQKSGFKTAAKRTETEYELVRSLIELRLKRKLTQKDLARKIGTKQPVISRLESFGSKPTFSLLQRISEALDSHLHISFQ